MPARLKSTYGAQVILMSHDEFRDTIQFPSNTNLNWLTLCAADLILGSFDCTLDTSAKLIETNNSVMGWLENSGTQFWPPLHHTQTHSYELLLINDLSHIASQRGEPYPQTIAIPPQTISWDTLPAILSDHILKRDSVHHIDTQIIFPEQRHAVNWRTEIEPVQSSWTVQQWIPSLQYFGKLRLICIDGCPVDVVYLASRQVKQAPLTFCDQQYLQVTTLAPLDMFSSLRFVQISFEHFTLHSIL
jgi:hypothetical protein